MRLLGYVDCLSRCTRRLVRAVLRGRGDGDIISQPDMMETLNAYDQATDEMKANARPILWSMDEAGRIGIRNEYTTTSPNACENSRTLYIV